MTTPDWWLDEQAHAGTEHLDAAYVAGYDAKAQVDPTADVAALVALGMGEGSVVVDLGAGTGAFTFAAAETGATVIAVDVAAPMVAALEERAADLPNVTVVQAGFLSYEHEGPPADVVYSRNALHQIPDFWKVVALDRIHGTLRPGGVLRLLDLVFDLEPDGITDGIEAWMAAAVDDPVRGYTAPEFADHVRSEHSTFTWLLEPMLERVGFEILDRFVARNVYATYTCRATSATRGEAGR